MKKQLTVALGLAVLATPAFATKARLEALGEDNFGSYYINDNRNIFLNAAKINENKDFVTYEFGTGSSNSTVHGGSDTAAQPRAEGGFAKAHGNFVYGAHFGNTTPTTALFRAEVTNGQERNPIDVFIGGDAGVKWGANVAYENYDGSEASGANRISSNALRTRFGAVMGDTEAFAQISLKGDVHNRSVGGATGSREQMEGKSSYFVGAGHQLGNYKLFADYITAKAEYGEDTTNNDIEFNRIRIGAGRAEKLNDRATMFTKLMVTRQNNNSDETASGGTDDETRTTTVPVNVGLEYDAVSWLQLRGSVGHTIYGTERRKVSGTRTVNSAVANTEVRAGASLKFGDFSVDGLVSNDVNGDGTGATTNTQGGNGALRTDNLLTRVSMIYRF